MDIKQLSQETHECQTMMETI